MTKAMTTALALAAITALAACEGNGTDKTRDFGLDHKNLSDLKAGIWVDPDGCDHWIVDDGLEGYLDARVDEAGKPVCSGIAEPTKVIAAEDLKL